MQTDPSPYDRWAPTYPPVAHNPLMIAEARAMTAVLLRIPRPSRALDLGAGTGRYGAWLRSRGTPKVIGFDRSSEMLRRNVLSDRVRGDATALPFAGGVFDLVVAGLVMGDLASLGAALLEVARVLTPDGHAVYSDFHHAWRERGWRRTFRDADGREVDVPFVSHAVDDHRRAAEGAGLRVVRLSDVDVLVPGRGPLGGQLLPAAVVVHVTRDAR